MSQTATREEIVGWFLDIDDKWELMRVNWHQHNQFTQNGMWDVTDETFINGVMLVVDDREYKGYLLQVVERETDVVSYVVITTYGSRCPECEHHTHDSAWYPDYAGTAQEPEVEPGDVARWSVAQIEGLFENARAGIASDLAHREGCSRRDLPWSDLTEVTGALDDDEDDE